MTTTIKQISLKNNRLSITREQLCGLFGEDTLYIFVIRLQRLIIIGKMDGSKGIEEEASAAAAKFGAALRLPPEIHTLNGTHVLFGKKWLEEVGKAPGDLAFWVTTSKDSSFMVIQFLGSEELLADATRNWLENVNVDV